LGFGRGQGGVFNAGAGLHMLTAVGTPAKHPTQICRIVRLFDTIGELVVSKSLP
jgi:hypothetical protein